MLFAQKGQFGFFFGNICQNIPRRILIIDSNGTDAFIRVQADNDAPYAHCKEEEDKNNSTGSQISVYNIPIMPINKRFLIHRGR